MNTADNLNILRKIGIPSAAVIVAVGLAACTGEGSGNSISATTSASSSAAARPFPSCTIKATANGVVAHREDFSIQIRNGEEPGLYAPDSSASWQFGDGGADKDGSQSYEPHTYQRAGSYVVSANFQMQASGPASPIRDGALINCAPVTVAVP